MKKLLLGLGLMCTAAFSQAQTMLDGVLVEKYHTATAADHALDPNLPIGAVTYRLYVDMKPGILFSSMYGDNIHMLKYSTTTSFYNSPGGQSTPNAMNNPTGADLYDSWVSLGAVSKGKLGVMVSENAAGSITGTISGITQSPNLDLSVFDGTTGNEFSTQGEGYASMLGVLGATATNRVLVGQFTTDGTFHYEVNFQLINASGDYELFVTSNPQTGEFVDPSLVGTIAIPAPPVVSITSPLTGSNVTIGDAVTIAANATDGGSITKVEFFDGATLINTDVTAPYTASFTPSLGVHSITAKATDNDGDFTTSTPVSVTVGPNVGPQGTITVPASTVAGDKITISATAVDVDGVASVEFFVDNVSIGIVTAAPYQVDYTSTSAGIKVVKAIAIDNRVPSASTTYASVNLNVTANPAPVVTVSTPASAIVGDVVNLTATATDADGIASVEFFVNGVSVGVDASAPYSVAYTTTLGSKSITAKATDSKTPSATGTSSAATLNVVANQLPTISALTVVGTLKVGQPVTFTATPSDNDGTISSVQFYVGGVAVGSPVTSAPFSFVWTAEEGKKTITASATDNKGGVSLTSPTQIIDVLGNATYRIKDSIAPCSAGNVFNMTIERTSDPIINALGFDFELFYDKTKVTPTGIVTINNDLINSSYATYSKNITDSSIIIGVNLTSTALTSFNGLGQLVSVEFAKTGDFQSVDTAKFKINLLEESYADVMTSKVVSAGKFITYHETNFVGALQYWSDYSPIGYVAGTNLITDITGKTGSTAVQPNAKGIFNYNITNGGKIAISRDIANTTDVQSVINAADAILAQKVAVKDASYIPSIYQIIAMDVNRDGSISSGDVSQINLRSVKSIGQFSQKGNPTVAKDWLFVDQDSITSGKTYAISTKYPENDKVGYSNRNVPQIVDSLDLNINTSSTDCQAFDGKTFKGILLGDANGSYKDIKSSSLLKADVVSVTETPVAKGTVTFDMSLATTKDNVIDVPVYISSEVDVTALDFALNFNESNLKFEKVVNYTANSASTSGSEAYYNSDDKTLRSTAFNFAPMSTSGAVASVRFSFTGDKVLSSDITSTKAYLNGELVKSEVTNVNGGISNNNATQVVEVYPNPTKGIVTLTASQSASVEIIDILGRVVGTIPNINASESFQYDITSLIEGVYTFKFINEKSTEIVKVVRK